MAALPQRAWLLLPLLTLCLLNKPAFAVNLKKDAFRKSLVDGNANDAAAVPADSSSEGGDDDDIFVQQTCMTPEQAAAAVERFSQLLQFRTVSRPAAPLHVEDPEQFRSLQRWAPGAFPEVWQRLEVEQVGAGGLSYLIRWPAQPNATAAASSRRLTTLAEPEAQQGQQWTQEEQQQQWQSEPPQAPPRPVLFISHLDVVPVAEETAEQWTHPPFSGAVEGGYVWGRGAQDVKVGVSGLLEAASLLLAEGWVPRRDLYFAFGQDEEVGGEAGAAPTARLLADRGVQLDMIFDEGGSVGADGFPPYTSHPLALVGTAEKGYATVEAHITVPGGHSSMPPLNASSAASLAARLISSLDSRPPPARLVPPVTDLLAVLARLTPGLRGRLFGWAAAGWGGRAVERAVAEGILGRDAAETAALVHTTAAVTGLSSGVADNVLPPAACVRVNFRLLPGDSLESLAGYLVRAAGSDLPHIRFELGGGQNASLATPVTPASSPYLGKLRSAIQEVFVTKAGGTVELAATLMGGGTDSKHYLPLSNGASLRHVPVSTNKTAGDLARIHGLNERLRVADHGRAVCAYRRLLQLVGTVAE